MRQELTLHPEDAAQAIFDAFRSYQAEFSEITQRARPRFEQHDWQGAQRDAVERLDLYKKVIQKIVSELKSTLEDQVNNRQVWSEMRAAYARLIPGANDFELAETFFNSITRRIFSTVGVDQNIEFVDSDFEPPPPRVDSPCFNSYLPDPHAGTPATKELVLSILGDFPFQVPYEAVERDALYVAQAVAGYLSAHQINPPFARIEFLNSVFYRSTGAYLVGRLCWNPNDCDSPAASNPHLIAPLVLCLRNTTKGIVIDTALLDQDDVSILFSFTRSYFHVEVERPHEMVAFLKTIMPLKRIAELYISIGYNKHGKTELYRDLLRHLAASKDQFKIAPGERGMVMMVFVMDSYDVVFKVIKDHVDPPKSTSRKEVMARYDLVFRHDRAGRLVDAQEFEHLRIDLDRFHPDLVNELIRTAPNTVTLEGDCVVIKHVYTERRMVPLNIYVKDASEEAAHQAVIDYGKAIKDLAATNIFPGDVLLKNFGVTRHGRVVFYDYDELCLLTDCEFRKMPQASNFDDDFEAEPWFFVGPNDIFPEEFRTFLGLQEPLRSKFIQEHVDLFGVEFWKQMQKRIRAGEVIEIFPYPESKRF